MCGRYVLHLRPSDVRRRLQEDNMPLDDWPGDDDSTVRQSYNFAPGYHGLVYRADVPDSGSKGHGEREAGGEVDGAATRETRYKLQSMKWGLIPFWTKRRPDYGSMMRTINCRDDSLATSGGMWNTMKQKKRCVVVCEGFFEWQKKNGGKDKIPHLIKRKDGQLMCFAGLWDCVKYEDVEDVEDKLYTYTIITTDSNKQLGWLHDRMPVMFDAGSEAIRTWLDPARAEWSRELQSLLKPYTGELEIYPVDKAVGKVGNNSPSFVIPVDSKENKNNIANFFSNQAKLSPNKRGVAREVQMEEEAEMKDEVKMEDEVSEKDNVKMKDEVKWEEMNSESNAPLPKPGEDPEVLDEPSLKRRASDDDDATQARKTPKLELGEGPVHSAGPLTARKTRSATTNDRQFKSPVKGGDGSAKITNFFSS